MEIQAPITGSSRQKMEELKPYKVKYWGLGNEMDGSWQMGAKERRRHGKMR